MNIMNMTGGRKARKERSIRREVWELESLREFENFYF